MSLKSVEKAIRRVFTRHIGTTRAPMHIDHTEDVLQLSQRPRIVVLRQDRIGDVLVSIPVIRALRERYPEACIDMVMSPNNTAARMAVSSWVDDVIVYHKSFVGLLAVIKRLRAGSYDVIIDLMDNASATSTLLITWARCRYAIGIDKSNRGVYTHVVPLLDRAAVHIVQRIAQLLMPFGIDPTRSRLDLEYRLTDEEVQEARATLRIDQRMILGVNISGSDASRTYGTDRFTEVISQFQRQHPSWRVVVLAAPSHIAEQREIVQRTGAEYVHPVESFHAFAAIVSQCSMILSADTSIVHLAAAWKVPAVILYVFKNPELMPWYPYSSPNVALHAHEAVSEITPQAVNKALDALSSSHSTT